MADAPLVPQLAAIRTARANGELLGDLVNRYGADLVVQALGVCGVAHILGLDEPIERFYEEDDDDSNV